MLSRDLTGPAGLVHTGTMKTTPSPAFDITERLLWLREKRSKVIRLHPRQVASSLPASASKMGWPFLWPKEEPWPVCNAKIVPVHIASYERSLERSRDETSIAELAQLLGHSIEATRETAERNRANTVKILQEGRNGHHQSYLPVLQLRRDDFPEIPFRRGEDIFQLLWCPTFHWVEEGPGHLIVWRNEQEVGNPRTDPIPEGTYGGVSECSLDPERITDLPSYFELRDDHGTEMDSIFDSWSAYDAEHGPAPGTKLFGCAEWVQGPEIPVCAACGGEMKLLVTVSSTECDQQKKRWLAIEDRDGLEHTMDELHTSDDPRTRVARFHQWQAMEVPHGLMIGDGGNAFLFYCPSCPEQPMASVVQCT